MPKDPIKLKPINTDGDAVTYETMTSDDKRTFVVRIESTCPQSRFWFMQALYVYAKSEIKKAFRNRKN